MAAVLFSTTSAIGTGWIFSTTVLRSRSLFGRLRPLTLGYGSDPRLHAVIVKNFFSSLSLCLSHFSGQTEVNPFWNWISTFQKPLRNVMDFFKLDDVTKFGTKTDATKSFCHSYNNFNNPTPPTVALIGVTNDHLSQPSSYSFSAKTWENQGLPIFKVCFP